MRVDSRREERELRRSREHLAQLSYSDPAWHAAYERVLAAERSLAAAQGLPYADVIDLGVQWNVGAPLPHLVANGLRATIVCRAAVHDPSWDGTWTRVVSPADTVESDLVIVDFMGCATVRFGAPNDEALHGHRLHGRGLVAYRAHEVRNSDWLEEHITVNSVHPAHRDEPWRRLRHILLAFHDETFEVLCRDVHARAVRGVFREVATNALHDLTGP